MLRRRVLMTVALVLGLLVLVIPTASADTGVEAEFVSLTNGARGSRGALKVDSELVAVARRWAAKMAADGKLAHNPNLANEVEQDWQKLGENVGTGDNAPQIHDAFMNSPSHRANILDGDFTHIGVGVARGSDGRIWVTEVFMRLRHQQPAPTTTAAPPVTAAPKPPPTAAPRTTERAAPVLDPTPTTAAPAEPEVVTASTVPLPARRSMQEGAAPPRYALVLEGLARLDRGG